MPNHSNQHAIADLVQSIADQLKPWKNCLDENQVSGEIEITIDRLKNPSLSQHVSSLVGSRRRRNQQAKKLFAPLKTFAKETIAAGLTFDLVLRPSDQPGLWSPKQTKEEGLYEKFHELLCASDSRLDHQKLCTAFAARRLMEKLSKKKLTISSDGNAPFCVIASQLFEAVSGERECSLISACRHVFRLRSEHIQPS